MLEVLLPEEMLVPFPTFPVSLVFQPPENRSVGGPARRALEQGRLSVASVRAEREAVPTQHPMQLTSHCL